MSGLTACDDADTPNDGSGGDAATTPQDAAQGGAPPQNDAGNTRDAASSGTDASTDAGGGSTAGAGSQDAGAAPTDAASDGSPADASTTPDAGGGSLRAQVCGTTSSWPMPLPGMAQRRAQPVGSESFGFIEGPVWIAEQGVLLFSDMDFGTSNSPNGPAGRIRRLKPPATFDDFAPSSNSNGLALSGDGALLAATHDNQALSRFDLGSSVRTKIDLTINGKHFNSPNDLVLRSDGTVYFTDPDWQIGPRTSETGVTGVYRVSPPLKTSGGNTVTLVDDSLNKPNGVALSPDERTLYVGSSGNEIWKYQVAADGQVSGKTKFVDTGSSDGLGMDCAGNLYVTSGTVEVFAPSGTKLGDIMLDGSPSNVAFGG
ncbi:MAG TPA: SMP-30/gluconolactonase/LRE family protein, partial [Polyangiales bacterium]